MEKNVSISLVVSKSGRAKVNRLEIPEALQKFNTTNNTLRVRLVACWATESAEGNPNDCSAILRDVVGNNEFSQIANLDGFVVRDNEGNPIPNVTAQQKVDAFKTAVLNKFFTATKYSVTIANLAKDLGENYTTLDMVNDPIKKRNYRSLTDCTLDAPSDDDKAIMYERLVNRLQKRLADGRLKAGAFLDANNNTPNGTNTIAAATGANVTL